MSDAQLSIYRKGIDLYLRVISQERGDKDKVYSLHKPEVECISKGKEHKKYEFGNKSAIVKTGSGLIVGALAFHGNPYDGHTLPAHLEQVRRLTGHTPKEALTDRGYRGKRRVGGTEISIPSSGTPGQSYYQKRKARKKFRRRAGIEPVLGHLKSDHRMMRNYLKGPAPWGRHQHHDGRSGVQYEALDEQTCLVFFCLNAADVGQTHRGCVVWE